MSSTQRLHLFYVFGSCKLHYGYSWINYTVNVRNVAAPCAWSARYYYKETHYRNDNSRDEMLHSTTVLAYYIFHEYWTCSVLGNFTKLFLGVDPTVSHPTGFDEPYGRCSLPNATAPCHGALTFMIYQEMHTATMSCGSKCNILLLCTMLCFSDCRLGMSYFKLIKYFGGEGRG